MIAMMNDRTAVAQQLADIADREGIAPCHVLRFPKLMTELNVAVNQDDVELANRLLRTAIEDTIRKVCRHTTSFDDVQHTVERERDVPKQSRKTTTGKERVKILGYSATAVLRWMGANDWSFEDAGIVMNTLGAYSISDATIRIQLNAGKKGERGPAAPVTKQQAKILHESTK